MSCGREVFGIVLCCVVALVHIPFVREMTYCVFCGMVVLVARCAPLVVVTWCLVRGVGYLTGCGGSCWLLLYFVVVVDVVEHTGVAPWLWRLFALVAQASSFRS